MEHLNNAKLEEFIDFYKTFYVPNNAVLPLLGTSMFQKQKADPGLLWCYSRGTKPILVPT
jgi:hypothetical protein